ncbi:FAD:protein FMN transferase [Chitinophaga pinensis]|uniref:FAD:protein FMN transferase n=1 Tax=Chitinophaga pinensis (strain ATCC 43595 / DSM 2588 / LMG 13176 / NBRC 15968 / NCIMB 11800 / UQM 2034) TaxID=485918 RepID=A0A979G1L2_CHIPD|nr:FAD:protein FMN transferase [Chitinophaga pinensis]ACU59093.1 ApbE family lipoprotein [Chitinophaga pinensis DSM 2588]
MQSSKLHTRLMGSDFELIATGATEAIANRRLEQGVAEIKRIESLLTVFSDTSVTAQLNAQAGGTPLSVPAEVYQLLLRCNKISTITQGAFDITASVLKKLFNFKYDHFTWPDDNAITQAMACTGFQHIALLDHYCVQLKRAGMHIDFGAIGKGYAADRVKALWIADGATSGVVNASGDLTAWGTQPDGGPWKVGIAHPDDPQQISLWLPVNNASVATSGNYEQYVERNGIRYSHNIDPRKGWPVPYIKSVTVVSPSAELSDALATAITVMGPEVGLNLVNQLPEVYCIIIDGQNKIVQSDNIQIHAKA